PSVLRFPHALPHGSRPAAAFRRPVKVSILPPLLPPARCGALSGRKNLPVNTLPVPARRRAPHRAARLCALVFCLLLPASLLVLPRAVRAALRVASDTPRADFWQRLYAGIPGVWKSRRVVLVREISDSEMDRLAAEDGPRSDRDDDSVVDALYRPGGGRG